MQLPQRAVYEIILKTVYLEGDSEIKCPKGFWKMLAYILLIPLTHTQYITIPDPMKTKPEGKENNLYPLTLFLATAWIWLYTFLIVWWTYAVTMAYDLHFSVLPMILYPFGIALRDQKKLSDMRSSLKVFRQ